MSHEHHHPPQERQANTLRLRKIIGQLNGVEKMLAEDRPDKVEEMLGDAESANADALAAQMAMTGGRLAPALPLDTQAAMDAIGWLITRRVRRSAR